MNRRPPATSSSARADLARLMPMHMIVDGDGRIVGAGPTLERLRRPQRVVGASVFDLFHVRRPHGAANMVDLAARGGHRLDLEFRSPPHTPLKGHFVTDWQGLFVFDLSFGILVKEAVSTYALTATDFAPTSLAVEMLYLVEANAAAMSETRDLIRRLNEAKAAAERLARTDALTGLVNRRGMETAIADLAGVRRALQPPPRRPRLLQGRQRHARPCRGRSRPDRSRAHPRTRDAGERPRHPPRRRRVRDHLPQHAGPAAASVARHPDHHGAGGAHRRGGDDLPRLGQHRHHHIGPLRQARRGADAPGRRYRALQVEGSGPLSRDILRTRRGLVLPRSPSASARSQEPGDFGASITTGVFSARIVALAPRSSRK